MKLELIAEDNVLTNDFIEWLIDQIKLIVYSKLDSDKLKQWDNYFNSSKSAYKRIYKKDVSTKDILTYIVENLTVQILPNKVIISVKQNSFIPGFDRVKVDTMCRHITYGTVDIKGYRVILDALIHIADNLDDYIDKYINFTYY